MPSSPIRDSSLRSYWHGAIGEDATVTVDCHLAKLKSFGNLSIGVDQLSLMERPFLESEHWKIRQTHENILSPPAIIILYIDVPLPYIYCIECVWHSASDRIELSTNLKMVGIGQDLPTSQNPFHLASRPLHLEVAFEGRQHG